MAITRFSGENAFLSNFYPAPVHSQGLDFPTVEHAYQAGKTADRSQQVWIRGARTPGEAKRRGRKVTLHPGRDRVAEMRMLLKQKFAPGTQLAQRLMRTHPRQLVEGNHWHDNFWGQCTCSRCPGSGQNQLGRILMELREQLLESEV